MITDAAQQVGIALGRVKSFETNGLVAAQAGELVDRAGGETVKAKMFARTNDEKGQGLVQMVKAYEIQIPAVHDVNRAGFRKQFVEHVNLVDFRGLDGDEGRDVALQIEQGVHFDARMKSTIASP